jgi:hypothetical protein
MDDFADLLIEPEERETSQFFDTDIFDVGRDEEEYQEDYTQPQKMDYSLIGQMEKDYDGGEFIGGPVGKRGIALSTTRQKQLIKAKEIMRNMFDDIDDKKAVMNKYQSISNIDTLNMELVVSSCVFLVKYKKLTPENFKEFVKEENKLFNSSSKDGFDMKKEDLLRYIRYLIKRVK